jgi:hypothetical protein
MVVKIGHASLDENNKTKAGNAGDQTAREVVIRDWYRRSGGWTTVFRAKDNKIAEKIAKAMEQACTNDKIGYDQNQRTTLYKEAKAVKWDISKIVNRCECDCSSLVSVCINAAGINISKDMYTGNQKTVLQATGKFEVLTDSKYLVKPDYLKRGDIILGKGHTVIVLSDGINVTEKAISVVNTAKSFKKSIAGTYKVTATKLNIRQGAGILKKVLVSIPRNTEVKCYGYYTKALGVDWLYVQFTYNGKEHTGFASAKYLAK